MQDHSQYIAALLTERETCDAAHKFDRVAAIDAELERVGAEAEEVAEDAASTEDGDTEPTEDGEPEAAADADAEPAEDSEPAAEPKVRERPSRRARG